MNRKEIKKEAKEKIKGNKFSLFWPVFIIIMIELFSIIIFMVPYIYSINDKTTTYDNVKAACIFGIVLVSTIALIFYISYNKFILDFIRNDRFDYEKIIEGIKGNAFRFLSAIILIIIITVCSSLLLIVPGIIVFLGYQMIFFVLIDSDYELGIIKSLKESRRLLKKYRLNYLMFKLSFIGWRLLSILTLGILNIWLIPYIKTSYALYYEKLKKIPREEENTNNDKDSKIVTKS